MKKIMRRIISAMLCVCLLAGGLYYAPLISQGADTLKNVANGRNGYTFMTSNANTPREGFLYVGNGFSAINVCNENLGNGNNLLGITATTEEAAVYVDLGKNYDISSALIYQGSTNANFYDSYCKSYNVYYSGEQVSAANAGNIEWSLAGSCTKGTIYRGAKIKNAENVSDSGDQITFESTYTARSVKIVFEKAACMGTGTNGDNTGTTGTVSLLSIRIFGNEKPEETTTINEKPEETTTGEGDTTLFGSHTDDLALKTNHSEVKGYASSNLRNGAMAPVSVNNLTNGNTTGTNFIIANTDGGDKTPWFAVDLGKVYDVNKVILTPGADGQYINAYPISYQVQVAAETEGVTNASDIEKLTWRTVAQVRDGKLASKSITFPRSNTRFVRILVESYADYCSLYELSVYETDDSRLLGEEEDIMNVLFVGNSMTYYNTLCKVVESFAKEQGKIIQCKASTQGGKNLIYHSTFSQTVSEIQSGAYDVVILQDIVGSFDGEKLIKGAATLNDMVKEYNPEAKVILYMPWPVKGELTGNNSKLPYFTYNYIKTARELGAMLAPAGEAYYTLYETYPDVAWYCDDEKHPHAIGTFISACAVYYALFPDAGKVAINDSNQRAMNEIINSNIAYSGDAAVQYDAKLLNDISSYGYYYTHAVREAVADITGKTKYTSVAGDYYDADDEIDKTGLKEVTGTEVDAEVFSKENGNIAVGCNAYASNERQKASYATDGNKGTRWETDYADPQWLYVDLGSRKKIEKVGFIWEGAYAQKYYIQVSDDAENWTTVSMVRAASAKIVQITLEEPKEARYVRMIGTRRGTQYGYSLYEMGVWETIEEPAVTQVELAVNGYQISTTLEGFRTVYSIKDVADEAEEVGMIYGLSDYITIDDMTVENNSQYVLAYKATENGKRPLELKDDTDMEAYTMTMMFGNVSSDFFNQKISVRVYAKLKNGQYIYSDVDTLTVYSVADELYQEGKMSTQFSHNYLFEKILNVVSPGYIKIDYNWNKAIVESK
ncbi:discoidin domain-containing protein [uncultured Eubacterium sp.]|uniref:discoidin domain-containing protein n=1 Tax=uncultured Eubacterium sp. TaxID=165185 RepID=UPI00267118EE|nr:discoidin domain-containing protein [uncultured Eubacterium sp.]